MHGHVVEMQDAEDHSGRVCYLHTYAVDSDLHPEDHDAAPDRITLHVVMRSKGNRSFPLCFLSPVLEEIVYMYLLIQSSS